MLVNACAEVCPGLLAGLLAWLETLDRSEMEFMSRVVPPCTGKATLPFGILVGHLLGKPPFWVHPAEGTKWPSVLMGRDGKGQRVEWKLEGLACSQAGDYGGGLSSGFFLLNF